MKQILSIPDKLYLESLVAEAEKQAGVQLVLTTSPRSGAYPEIPWKAFAAAAALSGLAVFITGILMAVWTDYRWVLQSIVPILGIAALSAAAAAFLPFYSRLFLSQDIASRETRQHADSLFLSKELYATSGRRGILILLSAFERRIVILPDRGLNDILTGDELNRIIGLMKAFLHDDNPRKAFELAVSELTAILSPSVQPQASGNELSDRIIEDRGI